MFWCFITTQLSFLKKGMYGIYVCWGYFPENVLRRKAVLGKTNMHSVLCNTYDMKISWSMFSDNASKETTKERIKKRIRGRNHFYWHHHGKKTSMYFICFFNCHTLSCCFMQVIQFIFLLHDCYVECNVINISTQSCCLKRFLDQFHDIAKKIVYRYKYLFLKHNPFVTVCHLYLCAFAYILSK